MPPGSLRSSVTLLSSQDNNYCHMLTLQSGLAGALVVFVGVACHVPAIWWVGGKGQSSHPMASLGVPGEHGVFWGGGSLQMAKLKKKLQPSYASKKQGCGEGESFRHFAVALSVGRGVGRGLWKEKLPVFKQNVFPEPWAFPGGAFYRQSPHLTGARGINLSALVLPAGP